MFFAKAMNFNFKFNLNYSTWQIIELQIETLFLKYASVILCQQIQKYRVGNETANFSLHSLVNAGLDADDSKTQNLRSSRKA